MGILWLQMICCMFREILPFHIFLLHETDCYMLTCYATTESSAIYKIPGFCVPFPIGYKHFLVGLELLACGMCHCTDVRCMMECS